MRNMVGGAVDPKRLIRYRSGYLLDLTIANRPRVLKAYGIASERIRDAGMTIVH